MCVTEIYRDRYPDGTEKEFRLLKQCQYGRPGWPCGSHRTMENRVRNIKFDEPTSEFILSRPYTPPRPSRRPASIVEVVDESPRRERRKQHRSSLLNTFFGQSPSPSPHRRRHRKENTVVIDTPPPSPSLRATRNTPAGGFWGEYGMPMTPPPFIRDASPRGRRPASIIRDDPPRRSTSTEVVIDAEPVRQTRSPSPATRRARRRQDEEDEEDARLRRRDERARILSAEVQIERDRQRRAREDAEIMARPALPPPPRRIRMRPVVEQSDRLQEMFGELNLGSTGQRVVADAFEADRRERLRRRFSVAGGPPPRRHRVLYDDGSYRYED